MKSKKIWSIVCILALIGSLAALGYAIQYRNSQQQGQEAYDEARRNAKEPEKEPGSTPDSGDSPKLSATPKLSVTPKETAAPTPTVSPAPTAVPVTIPVDFDALKEKNEEIYAWITVPGTQIDYPVVQSESDDSFYMHRGIDREYLYAGAIYTERKNNKDFTDFNTVLYGHNMKDGSMFAGLHSFKDRDFFDKNREVIIYTPEHIYHYDIFAAYTYDDRHILNTYDFENEEVVQTYLEEIYAVRTMDAYIRDKIKVTSKDCIITLSTCIGNAPSSRYLVQGVLKEVE
ncbi:class B sortase [Blautia schinkii]|nr:class B sortase [Blautia schinkii]